ncbi:MAG: methyltransferase domain-containing protein [Candidatus Acidiferrales bacterium]
MQAIGNLPPVAAAGRLPEEYFAEYLRQIVRPGDRILDAGCGSGKFVRDNFAKQAGCELVGVDIQETVAMNENLDFRVRASVTHLPFRNRSFNLVACRWTIEHVASPETALSEFYRILKTGGRLAVFTPNLFHYYGAAARLTPHEFHVWFNRRVRGFDECDIFPTYYRANTRRRLRRLLVRSGFKRPDVTLIEGAPNALAFNPVLHRVGKLYQFCVGRFSFLSSFRMNLIAIAHKE